MNPVIVYDVDKRYAQKEKYDFQQKPPPGARSEEKFDDYIYHKYHTYPELKRQITRIDKKRHVVEYISCDDQYKHDGRDEYERAQRRKRHSLQL